MPFLMWMPLCNRPLLKMHILLTFLFVSKSSCLPLHQLFPTLTLTVFLSKGMSACPTTALPRLLGGKRCLQTSYLSLWR